MAKIPCYLRTYRRQWSLTQKELARLLPQSYRGRVSTVERGQRVPNARELLAYAFIFNATPRSLFPAFAEEIEDAVMAGAYRLSQQIDNDETPRGRRKNELLRQMLARVTSDTPEV